MTDVMNQPVQQMIFRKYSKATALAIFRPHVIFVARQSLKIHTAQENGIFWASEGGQN